MPTVATLPGDLVLHPLGGDDRSADEQLKLFHLLAVVIDPYTFESSWILDTASRILTGFSGADCRPAWVVTCDEEGARQFLGELADRHLTFCDPDREFVTAIGANELPALCHVNLNREVAGLAEGWNPETWRPIAEHLAKVMVVEGAGDPRDGRSGPLLRHPGHPGLNASVVTINESGHPKTAIPFAPTSATASRCRSTRR